MLYVLPADPASPVISLINLRRRAKRVGYRIARDRYGETYSLIDTRLGVPLLGFDRVDLPAVAQAIETAQRSS